MSTPWKICSSLGIIIPFWKWKITGISNKPPNSIFQHLKKARLKYSHYIPIFSWQIAQSTILHTKIHTKIHINPAFWLGKTVFHPAMFGRFTPEEWSRFWRCVARPPRRPRSRVSAGTPWKRGDASGTAKMVGVPWVSPWKNGGLAWLK